MTSRVRLVLLSVLVFPTISPANASEPESVALTIYSSARAAGIPVEWYRTIPGLPESLDWSFLPGYAVVKVEREFEINRGIGELAYDGVAALLDPATVRFESLGEHRTAILQQDFRFDMADPSTMLRRSIDQEITVIQTIGGEREAVTGTLLSVTGGFMRLDGYEHAVVPTSLVLRKRGGGIARIDTYDRIDFPEPPGGLITKPTLVWKTRSETGGPQRTRVVYETHGITWTADYSLVFAPGEQAGSRMINLSAWVSILNRSGATFTDARLKLVDGEVHRAPRGRGAGGMSPFQDRVTDTDPRFDGKSLFEYALYTLAHPVTLPDNTTNQIELFETIHDVPVALRYVFDPTTVAGPWRQSPRTGSAPIGGDNRGVKTYLRIVNEATHGLGLPLPRGRVRVHQTDPADGMLEFIGEDSIDHLSLGESAEILLGEALDITGERVQTEFSVDQDEQVMSESIAVSVTNRKDEAVEVVVVERLYRWSDWEIVSSSDAHHQIDAGTIRFPTKIPPGATKTIRYTVKYSW